MCIFLLQIIYFQLIHLSTIFFELNYVIKYQILLIKMYFCIIKKNFSREYITPHDLFNRILYRLIIIQIFSINSERLSIRKKKLPSMFTFIQLEREKLKKLSSFFSRFHQTTHCPIIFEQQ